MNLKQSLFILVVIIFASCAAPKPFVFNGLKSIQIEKASLGKNIFKAQFEYVNPNKFAMTLNKIDCDVFINNEPFTHYNLDTNFLIPANATFQLPARMEVQLNSLLKNSMDILFNKPMKISVKGNATLSKGFVTKNLPIEFSTEQKLNLKAILGSSN